MIITTNNEVWEQLKKNINNQSFRKQLDGELFDTALELEEKLIKSNNKYDYEFLQSWVIDDEPLNYTVRNTKHYAIFVEKGTKPHFPPIKAIENWINYKKLQNSTYNKYMTTNQLQWAIQKSMAVEGTKGKFIVEKIVNNFGEDLDRRLLNFIEEYNKE